MARRVEKLPVRINGINMNPERLLKLDPHTYRTAIKTHLKDEEGWAMFCMPETVYRTRVEIDYMLGSIDSQKERVIASGTGTEQWVRSIDGLRRMLVTRLLRLPPTDIPVVSGNKEARAWRAFSARLADELAKIAPESLDTIQAPYGGESAAQWREAREGKAS